MILLKNIQYFIFQRVPVWKELTQDILDSADSVWALLSEHDALAFNLKYEMSPTHTLNLLYCVISTCQTYRSVD